MSARDRIDELLEQLRAQRPMSERSVELLVVELAKCRREGTVRGGRRSRRGRTEARLPTHTLSSTTPSTSASSSFVRAAR